MALPEPARWAPEASDVPRFVEVVGRDRQRCSTYKQETEGAVRVHGGCLRCIRIHRKQRTKSRAVGRVQLVLVAEHTQRERTFDLKLGLAELQTDLEVDSDPGECGFGEVKLPTAVRAFTDLATSPRHSMMVRRLAATATAGAEVPLGASGPATEPLAGSLYQPDSRSASLSAASTSFGTPDASAKAEIDPCRVASSPRKRAMVSGRVLSTSGSRPAAFTRSSAAA